MKVLYLESNVTNEKFCSVVCKQKKEKQVEDGEECEQKVVPGPHVLVYYLP